jgi:hypothetical protein
MYRRRKGQSKRVKENVQKEMMALLVNVFLVVFFVFRSKKCFDMT